ncbi:MAG: putative MAPEG superfamily protein [Paracoccaceae bacterium]|jgi:uncharacterized MAPEG superfamily protein
MPELVATYQTALLALAVLALALVVQSFISGLVKNGIKAQPSGVPVTGDISDSTFRIVRTHMNGIENASALFAASLLAMIAGADAQWITWLVLAAVALRLVYWPLYVFRIGKDGAGLRTFTHVIALVVNIVIAVWAVAALM